MKKSIFAGLAALICFLTLPQTVLANIPYKVFIDFAQAELPAEPIEKDGMVYLPIVYVLEKYQNTPVTITENNAGVQLSFKTSDGSFCLNMENGAYAYIIENESYGVSTMFSYGGEDKTGILKYKPIEKDGIYYLPADEIVEITDGSVNCDANLRSINITSCFYLDNIEFVGQPFPIVYVCTKLTAHQAEKLSNSHDYDSLITYCKDFEELSEYGDYDYQAAYNKLAYKLISALEPLKDNEVLPNTLSLYLNSNMQNYFLKDNSLTLEECADSIVMQTIKIIRGDENIEPVAVNYNYLKFAGYIVAYYKTFSQYAALDFSYNERLYMEQIGQIENDFNLLTLVYGSLSYIYPQKTLDYMDNVIYDHRAELLAAVYSSLPKENKPDNKMEMSSPFSLPEIP